MLIENEDGQVMLFDPDLDVGKMSLELSARPPEIGSTGVDGGQVDQRHASSPNRTSRQNRCVWALACFIWSCQTGEEMFGVRPRCRLLTLLWVGNNCT